MMWGKQCGRKNLTVRRCSASMMLCLRFRLASSSATFLKELSTALLSSKRSVLKIAVSRPLVTLIAFSKSTRRSQHHVEFGRDQHIIASRIRTRITSIGAHLPPPSLRSTTEISPKLKHLSAISLTLLLPIPDRLGTATKRASFSRKRCTFCFRL